MGQGSDLNRRSYDTSLDDYGYTPPVADSSADTTYEATTNQIEAEIEQTRAEMSETINAIQERLSPQHLAEQAKDAVYDATIGTAKGVGSNMLETIKQNPLPAAIAALSIGWLFRKSSSMNNQNSNQSRRYATQPYQPYQQYQPYEQYGYDTRYRSAAYDDRSAGITDRVGDVAENVKDRVGDVAENVKDQAQHMASNVRHQAEHYGDQAMEQVDEARDWLQHTMNTNPMALAAVAVAVGTAVGLALPGTPVENRVMGEARESLVEKVQETASQTIDKVQNVAKEVASTAEDEVKLKAREQGLTK